MMWGVMHFIYKITNTINDKVYIGQTNNPSLRWSQHKSNAKYDRGRQVITRALLKYGSRNPDIGYNVDKGGNVVPRSPEIAVKISQSLQKYYEINNNWNKGGV